MTETPHWAFVTAAYAVTAFGLLGLMLFVLTRLQKWEKIARGIEGGDA
jgi:hypothetical protein